MALFFDSYAWIEYFKGSGKGEKVFNLLKDNKIYTSSLSIAEVISKFKRENLDFEDASRLIMANSNIVNVDSNISKQAGILHAEIKKKKRDFGLVDAIILASANKLGAKVVTGDPHFKNFKETILLD